VPSDFDLGLASNDWAREALQTLVDMTVQMQVNERGQAAFNLLGMGNFTVTVSGDRSQVALAADDHTLFSMRRLPTSNAEGDFLGPPAGGGYTGEPLPKLREAVQYVADMASHPLSLLIYCLVAVYLLLWSLLSQQAGRHARSARDGQSLSVVQGARPERKATRKHRPIMLRPSKVELSRASASPDGSSSSGRKRQRKRIRVRIRIRKSGLRHPS
jgi:hypothetical protein